MAKAERAFDRGLRAYRQGLYKCPYAANAPQYGEWNEGYNYGRIEEEAERLALKTKLARLV